MNASTQQLPRWSRFPRYLVVGGIATGSHYAVFAALIDRALEPGLGAAAGAGTGGILSYLLNRYWTFDSRRPHRQAIPVFVGVAALIVLANALLVGTLADRLGSWPAQIVATGCMTLLGFLAHRKWSFA